MWQGFWAHGNLLASLPQDFGNLANLHTISLAGNRLKSLPKSISGLINLRDLGLQGNELTEVPAEIGALSELCTLSVQSHCVTCDTLFQALPCHPVSCCGMPSDAMPCYLMLHSSYQGLFVIPKTQALLPARQLTGN